MLYLLKLSCGHPAVTSVQLKLQYPNDTHLIFCPSCRNANSVCDYGKRLPTAWNEVVSYREVVPNASNSDLLLMLKRDALVLPRDVMRLQPTVPRSRIRPFPYVNGVRR